MTRALSMPLKPSREFFVLAAFVFVIFATGGSSRNDEVQLVVLQPFALLFCAFAIATLRRDHVENHRALVSFCGIAIAMAALHLVPLPPSLWHLLPGRDSLVTVDALSGVKNAWRPLTLTPSSGWHALLSLSIPLTTVLLAIQLRRDDRIRLLALLIGLAATSGFIGLLQSVSDPDGALYFYRVTNNGTAVGFFANRNHAATLLACLFPMLAVYAFSVDSTAGRQRSRQLWCFAIAIVLVPLILIIGSRSGLLLSIIGLLGAALLYRTAGVSKRNVNNVRTTASSIVPLASALVVVILGLLTVFFSRAKAINRLFDEAGIDDGRSDFLIVSSNLIWKYFPLGSGSGSFVETYKTDEPGALLDLTYLNHAHNDWAETIVAFGLPGLILLFAAVCLYLGQTYRIWKYDDSVTQSAVLARMASIGIAIIAAASFSDYPLRTPIMMCVLTLLTIMFLYRQKRTRYSEIIN